MKKKIVIGLPSYNEADSIGFVLKQIDTGLKKFYNPLNCLIVNVDSDSQDETKEVFLKAKTFCPKKYLNTGKSPRGKGKNLLKLFKFCSELDAQFVTTIDSDVKTVQPDWVYLLLNPLITRKSDYSVPIYTRNRFEANVTHHFAYPLIYAVFNLDLRQPIGGDFALSKRLYKYLLKKSINQTVLEYGIDIFMTLHAIGGGFKISEVFLGKKIHRPGFSGLMYKFLQIAQSAIKVSRAYKLDKKLTKIKPIRYYKNQTQIDEVENKPDKAKVLAQIEQYRDEFKKNLSDYPKYLGKLTNRVNRLIEKRELKLSANLWTSVLANFLNICYKEQFDTNLTPRISKLIAPIFFWRAISFWQEVEGLASSEVEKKIREQAELLRSKI